MKKQLIIIFVLVLAINSIKLSILEEYKLLKKVKNTLGSDVFVTFNPRKNKAVTLKAVPKNYRELIHAETEAYLVLKNKYGEHSDKFHLDYTYRVFTNKSNVYFEKSLSMMTFEKFLKFEEMYLSPNHKYKEGQKLLLLYQLSEALEALHDANIVHRNLKPDSIFLNKKGELVLSELQNSATEVKNNTILSFSTGSPQYMAPEVFFHSSYSRSCDIWSFGILTYYTFFNKIPDLYWHDQLELISSKIVKSNIESIKTELIKFLVREFEMPRSSELVFQNIFSLPSDRPNIQTIRKILENLIKNFEGKYGKIKLYEIFSVIPKEHLTKKNSSSERSKLMGEFNEKKVKQNQIYVSKHR